jgi:anti-sigma factor RsiW
MNQESRESAFEARTREVLGESAGRLDGRQLSRLTQARHAALEQMDRRARPAWLTWIPAGAATAAAVLAVVIWAPGINTQSPMTANVGNGAAFEDIDLLVDAPEFVADADDMDFYEWAAGEIES